MSMSSINLLGQVMGRASCLTEGKSNTVNKIKSGGSNLSKISAFGDYLSLNITSTSKCNMRIATCNVDSRSRSLLKFRRK